MASRADIPRAVAVAAGAVMLVTVVVVWTRRARVAPAAASEEPPAAAAPVASAAGGSPPRPTAATSPDARPGEATLSLDDERRIVERAREEIRRVTVYDASWMETDGYPMGDVPAHRGACTDVVVRSLRSIRIDLQQLVHEDVERDASAYGLARADRHIDHRRITTMHAFFARNMLSLTTNVRDKAAFRPGDVVFYTWSWGTSALAEHAAIVSDTIGPRGYRLLLQNGGPRPSENDTLDRPHMLGHYRAITRR